MRFHWNQLHSAHDDVPTAYLPDVRYCSSKIRWDRYEFHGENLSFIEEGQFTEEQKQTNIATNNHASHLHIAELRHALQPPYLSLPLCTGALDAPKNPAHGARRAPPPQQQQQQLLLLPQLYLLICLIIKTQVLKLRPQLSLRQRQPKKRRPQSPRRRKTPAETTTNTANSGPVLASAKSLIFCWNFCSKINDCQQSLLDATQLPEGLRQLWRDGGHRVRSYSSSRWTSKAVAEFLIGFSISRLHQHPHSVQFLGVVEWVPSVSWNVSFFQRQLLRWRDDVRTFTIQLGIVERSSMVGKDNSRPPRPFLSCL